MGPVTCWNLNIYSSKTYTPSSSKFIVLLPNDWKRNVLARRERYQRNNNNNNNHNHNGNGNSNSNRDSNSNNIYCTHIYIFTHIYIYDIHAEIVTTSLCLFHPCQQRTPILKARNLKGKKTCEAVIPTQAFQNPCNDPWIWPNYNISPT